MEDPLVESRPDDAVAAGERGSGVEALVVERSNVRILVDGQVQRGDQRGRLLGFPTANLALDAQRLVPPDGVYAARVRCADGLQYQAAVSVGRRVTFYEDHGLHLLEAHLIGFCGDLYGATIEVELVAWLRAQVRFSGVDQLVKQLEIDVERVVDILSVAAASGVPRSRAC